MKKECKLCKYIWNILISIDQLGNTILGGSPDETISSRLGKWGALHRKDKNIKYYIAVIICWLLNLIDENHCKKSIEEDEGDRDLF